MVLSSTFAVRVTAHHGLFARLTTARPRPAVAMWAACTALMVGLWSAEAADASGWSLQRTPDPAGAQERVLEGVSCASKTACIAVGWFSRAGTRMLLAERWNGIRWMIQRTASPAGAKSAGFRGVSCSASNLCIAVGWVTNSAGVDAPLAERWNGSRWAVQRTPRTSGVLAGVSCGSKNTCVAVGSLPTTTLAERWDGRSWTIQRMPSRRQAALNAVSCWSRTGCIAVGTATGSAGMAVPLAERLNGGAWKIQRVPVPAPGSVLESVSCSSRTACTAVGVISPVFGGDIPLAARWNGSRWMIQRTPEPSGTRSALLSGVWCLARTACVAVGQRNLMTLAERWNGSRWTIQRTPNPTDVQTSQLLGVACPSTTRCIAVGYSRTGATTSRLLAERY